MGTHLGKGDVIGNHLRCPLHHWEYDGQGICRRIPGADVIPGYARQRAYPVVERYGGVFIFNGPEPLFSPPAFTTAAEDELWTVQGRPIHVRSPWYALAANGFDMQHLGAVHGRALREPPALELLDRYHLQLRYVSRVTGRALADRVMKWLSRDRIAGTVTCWGGGVITVESDLGRVRSMLLLNFMPVSAGTEITPIFAVRRSGVSVLDALRIMVASWLFYQFLDRDLAIMEGIDFCPRLTPADDIIRGYLEFLASLPAA
jgi:hypothetical protein